MRDEQLVARYAEVGIRALVTESGLSYGTVRARLAAAGVLRPVGVHIKSSDTEVVDGIESTPPTPPRVTVRLPSRWGH